MSDELAIRLRAVVKRYGAITAVNALDLDVPTGTCVGLLGPNGAGKSTTMRLLTAQSIADRTFRLCHCDVDVYQSAKDVFDWAWERLSPGGLAVFDDYGFPACPGVTKFVDEQRGRDDRLVLHNLNGHGIVVKR